MSIKNVFWILSTFVAVYFAMWIPLSCSITGTLRAGEFPMCAAVFGSRQDFVDDQRDRLRRALGIDHYERINRADAPE